MSDALTETEVRGERQHVARVGEPRRTAPSVAPCVSISHSPDTRGGAGWEAEGRPSGAHFIFVDLFLFPRH